MAFGRFFRPPGEYTKVGTETEVTIPWQTYVAMTVILWLSDLSLWGMAWMLWFQRQRKQRTFWRWFRFEWLPWMFGRRNWTWVGISLVLCFGLSTGIYFYRLLVEQVTKQGPQYQPLDPREGRWRPFQGHKEPPDSEEEWEPEDIPYVVDGRMVDNGGSTERYLEFKLDNYASALAWHRFCKAVTDGANFSYNEAVKRQGLSPEDWKRIYRAFIAAEAVIPAGPRGTPTLKAVGKWWVKQYALTPPPPPE